ncbi:putative uncharacterized protein DDB_G0291812 [Anneissia japonica]|uniref:putative uncharacterized protein DDB_G0291812 n=1 Tax=Anneissia japonica TaxID=1529436 RepID=UPI00142560E3|nr:putative uncharacterized protein DDB_G0291812 [Anneissia japonica]XP_033113537.1 putative uncharacterized protein DDB_G0291812 [Anneissia japonica]
MDSLDEYTQTLQRSMRQDLDNSVNKAMLSPRDILTRSHESIMRDLTDPRQWYLADSHRELVNLMQQAQLEKPRNQSTTTNSHDNSPPREQLVDELLETENVKSEDKKNCEVALTTDIQSRHSTPSPTDFKAIEIYRNSKSPRHQLSPKELTMKKPANSIHHIMISDIDTLRPVNDLGKVSKPKPKRPLPSHRQKIVTFDEHGNKVVLPEIKSKSADDTDRRIEFVENWIHKLHKNNLCPENMKELCVIKKPIKVAHPEYLLNKSFPLSSLQTRNRILSQLSLSSPVAMRHVYNLKQQSKQTIKKINNRNSLLTTLGEEQAHVQSNRATEQNPNIQQTSATSNTEYRNNDIGTSPNQTTVLSEKQHIKTFLLSLMDPPNGISDTKKRYVLSNDVNTNEDLLSSARKTDNNLQGSEKQELPSLSHEDRGVRKEMSVIDLKLQSGHIPNITMKRNKPTKKELHVSSQNDREKCFTDKAFFATETNAESLQQHKTMTPMKTFIQLQVFDHKFPNETEVFPYPLPLRKMPRKLGSLKATSIKESSVFLEITGKKDKRKEKSKGRSKPKIPGFIKHDLEVTDVDFQELGTSKTEQSSNHGGKTSNIVTITTSGNREVNSESFIKDQGDDFLINTGKKQTNKNIPISKNEITSNSDETVEHASIFEEEVDDFKKLKEEHIPDSVTQTPADQEVHGVVTVHTHSDDTRYLMGLHQYSTQGFKAKLGKFKEEIVYEEEEQDEVEGRGKIEVNKIKEISKDKENGKDRKEEEAYVPDGILGILNSSSININSDNNNNSNNNIDERMDDDRSSEKKTESNTENNGQLNQNPHKTKSAKNVTFSISQ